jgi:plasmid stabilization system protein ParE
MNLPIRFSPVADRELAEAVAWYEGKRAGLGGAFVDRVEEALERVARMPELHAPVYRDLRRARLHQFPFSVVYRVLAERIEVVAVAHDRQDPRRWRSRAGADG